MDNNLYDGLGPFGKGRGERFLMPAFRLVLKGDPGAGVDPSESPLPLAAKRSKESPAYRGQETPAKEGSDMEVALCELAVVFVIAGAGPKSPRSIIIILDSSEVLLSMLAGRPRSTFEVPAEAALFELREAKSALARSDWFGMEDRFGDDSDGNLA